MKTATMMSYRSLGFAVVVLAAAAAGCSKKEQPPTTVTPPGTQTSQAAGEAQAAAPAAPPAQENYATVDAGLAQAQAAMKAKEYDRAVNTLSSLRTGATPMTGQQLMQVNRAQIDLQNQLSAAAAAGDPRAKAAYEMLRQRALYHQ